VVVDAKVDGETLGHFYLFCRLSMGCENNNFPSKVMNYIERKQAFLEFFSHFYEYLRPFTREGFIFSFLRIPLAFRSRGFVFYFYEYLRPFAREGFVFHFIGALGSMALRHFARESL
jgi:hypothetical protein